MQYFYPDHRNLGGRSIILSQVYNHRVSLQQIKDRQQIDLCASTYRSPLKIQNKQLDQIEQAKSLQKHRKKIQDINNYPLTDRGPSLFFRRIPSPQKQALLQLLQKKPLSYRNKNLKIVNKSKENDLFEIKTNREKQLSLIPDYSYIIDWNGVLNDLDQCNIINKEQLKQISIKYQIYSETDFAIFVRLLMQTYPNLQQSQLVHIFSQIIEELEQ